MLFRSLNMGPRDVSVKRLSVQRGTTNQNSAIANKAFILCKICCGKISQHVKNPLAEELLFGKLQSGGIVRVDLGPEGKLVFSYPGPVLPPKPKLPALVE